MYYDPITSHPEHDLYLGRDPYPDPNPGINYCPTCKCTINTFIVCGSIPNYNNCPMCGTPLQCKPTKPITDFPEPFNPFDPNIIY